MADCKSCSHTKECEQDGRLRIEQLSNLEGDKHQIVFLDLGRQCPLGIRMDFEYARMMEKEFFG